MKQLAFALAATLGLVACGQKSEPPTAPVAAADQPAETTPPAAIPAADPIDVILAGSWRSDSNKARDAYRHPKETLAFFGVKPESNVIEIAPGGGWYTEILAPLLKANGQYTAAFANDASSDYAKRNNEKFRAKLAEDAERFGAATLAEFDPKAPNLGTEGTADVVLTFRNVHNWIGGGSAPSMFAAFNTALKPGGVLGVVEHRAAAGANLPADDRSGYVDTETVIKLATDAGFQLVEQSEINANPKDSKDYEKGVWTLPPSLALGDVDRDKYLAIGESDRMTLKFVKPAGDKIFNGNEAMQAAAEREAAAAKSE
jgi:predicted methyltransferase